MTFQFNRKNRVNKLKFEDHRESKAAAETATTTTNISKTDQLNEGRMDGKREEE